MNGGAKVKATISGTPNIFQGADSAETRGIRYASTDTMRVGSCG